MKSNLLYPLLVIVVFASGCFGNKNSAPAPAIPSGNFTGQFRRVHTSPRNGAMDTLKANLMLSLNVTTGFAVTGDTATVHAGSHGSYAIGSSYIEFSDVTFPPTGTPTKIHLSGVYQYYYDGTVFQMVANSYLDTISYQYDMKKVN